MPDPLYDAILTAIDKPLDGDTFERCAVDLLRQNYYPSLRPVEGGNDAGMDGLGELADGEEFFLVSTVSEDARANLDRNVRSYLKAGGERRTVIFATSRAVGGQTEMRLKRYLRTEFDVDLRRVHSRGDFINLLYHNPRWRIDLLGVPGVAKPLTRLPITWRTTPAVRLIGRDDDLQKLRSARGDLVLVGKPGVGKTFLLETLMGDDWGLFDAGWDVSDLEDAIREFLPRRVVIDDAHLVQERIAKLRQLRREMDAPFDIVAVSWPGQQEDVAAVLPGSSRYVVGELDRNQILELVQEVGVDGPRELQALIVHEAMGRAGLAVSLAYAYMSGSAREVASGDALITDLVNWHRRIVGAESRYVLGFLSLAGNSGATTNQLANALGLSPVRTSEIVRGLAFGGTLDEILSSERVSYLRVQPEIFRYALVRDVFFGGPGSLDLQIAITCLERPAQAAIPVIGAIHRGATVSRELLLNLVDASDEAAVVAYALLGEREAQQALEFAPGEAKAIARAAYEEGLCPDRMLRVLMEFAVGDARPENSYPDHSLRIVGDYLRGPRSTMAARRLAVSVAEAWLRDGRPPDVGFRLIGHALYPGVRHVYSDPGLGNTVTISDAAMAEESVRELSNIWDVLLHCVEREQQWPSFVPVIQALHPWVYPSVLARGQGPGEATARTMRDVAADVIARLSLIWQRHPGALHRLRNFATTANLGVSIAVPPDFDTIFPDAWDGREDRGGFEGWKNRVDQALADLATQLLLLPPEEIAARLASADAEASTAGIAFPRLTPALAQLIASQIVRPELLLDALEGLNAQPDVLVSLLAEVVDKRAYGWESTLNRLLDNERTLGSAALVVLTKPLEARLKDAAISRLNQTYVGLVDGLVIRALVDPDTLVRLLNAPDRVIVRETAVALAQPAGVLTRSDLTDAARQRWREVIVQSPADEYWYSVILNADQALFFDWIMFLFERVRRHPLRIEFFHENLLDAIAELPSEVRARVIRALPSDIELIVVNDVVGKVVSADLEVARALFERQDLSQFHWLALQGEPTEPWMIAFDKPEWPTLIFRNGPPVRANLA